MSIVDNTNAISTTPDIASRWLLFDDNEDIDCLIGQLMFVWFYAAYDKMIENRRILWLNNSRCGKRYIDRLSPVLLCDVKYYSDNTDFPPEGIFLTVDGSLATVKLANTAAVLFSDVALVPPNE